jgi:(p)ppGpp synthase/HD superfamily hydrolase
MSDEREDTTNLSDEHQAEGFQGTGMHPRVDDAILHARPPVADMQGHQDRLPGLDTRIAPEMLLKAATYAAAAHAGQMREGLSDPYVNHVLRVAYRAACAGLADDAILAALLHDTVEDCDVTFDNLRAHGFSPRTVDLVRLLTKDWTKREPHDVIACRKAED